MLELHLFDSIGEIVSALRAIQSCLRSIFQVSFNRAFLNLLKGRATARLRQLAMLIFAITNLGQIKIRFHLNVILINVQ